MTDGASPRVLVVLASNDRRGAEIEGERLAQELAGHGFLTEVVALSAGHGRSALPVPALGEQALAAGTVRALRRRARDAGRAAFGADPQTPPRRPDRREPGARRWGRRGCG